MTRLATLALLTLTLTGCTTQTLPPVRYPDLTDPDTPRESLGTVREANHCFIGYVDEVFLTQFDVNPISPGTYRQLQFSPGPHRIAVFYRWQRNLDTVSAGPRFITLDVAPGAKYVLQANTVGYDAPFQDTLRVANWRPSIIDEATGQQVALSPINR